jgi:hypothetical protein
MNPYHEGELARKKYQEAIAKGSITMGTEANKRQVGGTHYKTPHGIEHWDLVAMFGWDYFQAQIIRYVMRWRAKGGMQDLEKARHYLDKYMEVERAKQASPVTGEQPPQGLGDQLAGMLQQAKGEVKLCPHGIPLRDKCEVCDKEPDNH